MNGEVKCGACGFADSYVSSLASAMPGDDPLPSELVARPSAPRPMLVEVTEPEPRAIMLPTPVSNLAAILSLLFGALARYVAPDRRIRLTQRPRPLARQRRIHRRLASVVGRP
jgi:hypothetical protein